MLNEALKSNETINTYEPNVRYDSLWTQMDPVLQHLKNCTAVWVVSSIHRAIDDKTAKDLLGENFRRQLLMDGQYGNIAFICTKTDVIKNSEIIRSLPFVLKNLNAYISVKQEISIYIFF